MTLEVRDITQAYVQSQSRALNHELLVHLPKELKERYQEGILLRFIKPLYRIAKAGLHWFTTYQKHHHEKLGMEASSSDPCLSVSQEEHPFSIIGLRTHDKLLLGDPAFMQQEKELQATKFKAKPPPTPY